MRRVLDDRTIDAVSIATPNHWHSLMAIWACQAGKDCYLESPLSHSFREGQQLIAAVNKYRRLVQHGIGELGENSFDPATLAGLGSIRRIRTVIFADLRSLPPPAPKISDQDSWDLWLGPAGKKRLFSKPDRPDWKASHRMHNGALGFFALPSLYKNLELLGGKFPAKVSSLSIGSPSNLSAGTRLTIQLEIPDSGGLPPRQMSLELALMRGLPGRRFDKKGPPDRPGIDTFEETTVEAERGRVTFTSNEDRRQASALLLQNFVAAVRSKGSTTLDSPVEAAHLACGTLHLANISLTLNRPVRFDTATQAPVNDPQAQRLFEGSHRSPYVLPKII
jgi:hypothetical protein